MGLRRGGIREVRPPRGGRAEVAPRGRRRSGGRLIMVWNSIPHPLLLLLFILFFPLLASWPCGPVGLGLVLHGGSLGFGLGAFPPILLLASRLVRRASFLGRGSPRSVTLRAGQAGQARRASCEIGRGRRRGSSTPRISVLALGLPSSRLSRDANSLILLSACIYCRRSVSLRSRPVPAVVVAP